MAWGSSDEEGAGLARRELVICRGGGAGGRLRQAQNNSESEGNKARSAEKCKLRVEEGAVEEEELSTGSRGRLVPRRGGGRCRVVPQHGKTLD